MPPDDVLPHRERHCIPCDAPRVAVMRAAEEVTWREVPVFRDFMISIFSRHTWLRAILHRVLLIDRLSGAARDHRKACVMRHEQRPG
jgi:hypothetical protein